MSDGEKVSFLLDLDSAEFVSKITSSVEYVKNLQENLAKVATVAGVVGAAYLALKTSLSLALQADELRSLEVQFEALSKQAGVAGDEILAGMKKASDGLIDTSDLMQIANKSLVQLGNSASRIPEIMAIARKASVIFGTSTEEAFERISQAIATGQTRQLKQLGVVIDSEKAYRDYAKSIGIATNELSAQGKVQAIANAAIPQLNDKLKNVDTTVKQTSDSWTKLKNSVNEVYEALAKTIGPSVAPGWTKALNAMSSAVNGFADRINAVFSSNEAEKASATINIYETRLEGLRKKLAQIRAEGQNESIWNNLFGLKDSPAELAAKIEQQIMSAEGVLDAQREKLKKGKLPEDTSKPKAGASGSSAGAVDNEQGIRNQQKFYSDLNTLREADLNARILTERTFENVEYDMASQRVLVEQKSQQAILAIRQDPALNPEQRAQLEVSVAENKAAQLAAIDRDLYQRKIAALDNESKYAESTFSRISAANKKSALEQTGNQTAAYRAMSAGVGAFSSNFASAFKAMGAGQKDFADVTKQIFFGMLGAMSDQYGAFFLAKYIASDFTDFGALAGSAAFFALAGALSALGGSGTSTGGGSAGGGGAAVSSSEIGSAGAPAVTAEREKRSVNINIAGHLFDTPQTGVRIAEILRDVTGATDIKFT